MKIVYVPDIADWAIGSLVNAKVKYTPHNENFVIPIHPRDAKEKALDFLAKVQAIKPDVICYEYFRSAEQLINACPELKNYRSVLVHHNQRDKAIFHANWNDLGINTIVTHTSKCREKLNAKGYMNVETINHGINLEEFVYSEKEPEVVTLGYVGRIVPWKGLKEIAEAAIETNFPVQIMGKMDKADYWQKVPQENLRFDYFDCTNEERKDAYHNMTVYIGNSDDDYEEGTLPFLEAMASGTPVITTPNGVAKDIAVDGFNALVIPFNDKPALVAAIKRLMGDAELRSKLRKNAWNTVKNMPEAKMAYEYSRLFYNVRYKDPVVSVIIPATIDRVDQVKEIIRSLENQDYEAIEAVVVWDEYTTDMPAGILDRSSKITIKQIVTDQDGYNLAKARNMGVVEAEGEYLMFCDSRLLPENDAVKSFVYAGENVELEKPQWFFGDKGSQKKSFVENFSFVRRDEYIKFGMMSEQIDKYGGMSQEIRTRWIKQHGEFQFLPEAKATEMMKSSLTMQKRQDIIGSKLKLYKMYLGENH